MQDEEIDRMDEIIREASNSYHPAYNDKAWEKMEVLLDKHLPQKGERRRPFAFYLLLLLVAGGAIFVMLYPWKKNINFPKTTIANIQEGGTQQPLATTGKQVELYKPTVSVKDNSGLPSIASRPDNDITGNIKTPLIPGRSAFQKSHIKISNSDATDEINEVTGNKAEKSQSIKTESNEPASSKHNIDLVYGTHGRVIPVQINNNILLVPQADSDAVKGSTGKEKIEPLALSKPAPDKTAAKKKVKRGFANNFAVTVSAGPDLSFVSLDVPGKIMLSYGAGLRYTISKRLTISTGFYQSRKIYSATPGDYHPPTGNWTYYTDLKRVDADCKIYEIPLAVSYNFKQSVQHNWFAGIGLSSLIMKNETYHYLYKNSQGQTMYRAWTVKEKNKHFLSVLIISGGYQYQLNHRISFIAEPFLKLPLQGIGFGKIKLNSGGLLMTASIKPFKKRK